MPTCATMFPHANSKSGTVTIEGVVVDRGYWRANNKSDNVLSCYNADACLGGLTGDPGYCSDGYEGPCELPAMTRFTRLLLDAWIWILFVWYDVGRFGLRRCAKACVARNALGLLQPVNVGSYNAGTNRRIRQFTACLLPSAACRLVLWEPCAPLNDHHEISRHRRH